MIVVWLFVGWCAVVSTALLVWMFVSSVRDNHARQRRIGTLTTLEGLWRAPAREPRRDLRS